MATNQSDRQAAVEASTGTSLNYEGDWHALFTNAGIADGAFNCRLLAYINSVLGSSYVELNGALQAFAIAKTTNGASSWNELGTFTTGPAVAVASQLFTSLNSNSPVPSWLDSSATTGNRMLWDSTGALTYAPNNMIKSSNTLNGGVWTVQNGTMVQGAADPFGGTSAWTFTSIAGGTSNFFQGATFNGNALSTIWIRRNTGSGTVQFYLPSNVGQTVTLTGAWQQFSKVASVVGSGFSRLSVLTIGDAVDIYAPTLSAVTYETTARAGDQVITNSSAYFGPRFDSPAGVGAGLLIEEARTNVALSCRDMTNAAWVKTNITAALTQTGIDGTANSASSITATLANGTVLQSITLASSQRFQTAYVKRITGTGAVNMTTDGGTTWTAVTVTGAWTRVSIPAQTVTNPSVGFQITTLNDAIAVDFVQNETGAFSTYPIYTTTAAVTRPADINKLAGTALTTIGGVFGTVLQEVNLEGNTAANQYGIFGGGVAPIYYDAALAISATNGTNVLASGSSATVGVAIRAALAWNAAGRAISVNGSAAVTDANPFGTIGSLVYDGSNNGSNVANGWVKAFSIYNTKLTNATLATKSVTGGAL